MKNVLAQIIRIKWSQSNHSDLVLSHHNFPWNVRLVALRAISSNAFSGNCRQL